MPAPMMLPSRGWTRLNVSETERSAFPSRTSLTAWISAPCSQYQPTKLDDARRGCAPNQPSEQRQHDPDRRDDDEDDERDHREVRPVPLVELPSLADDAAQRIHGREPSGAVG